MKVPKPYTKHFSFWAKLKYFFFGFDHFEQIEPCKVAFRCKECSSSFHNASGKPPEIEDPKRWCTNGNPRWLCPSCGADINSLELYIGRKRSVGIYNTREWIRPFVTESFDEFVDIQREAQILLNRLPTKPPRQHPITDLNKLKE